MSATLSPVPDVLTHLPRVLASGSLEGAEERVDTIQALRRLTQLEREVVYLRYATGLPIRSVAAALGISYRRERTTEQAALRKLTEVML